MSKKRIIDAHHHLWDLSACHYPWLMASQQKRFFGDPTPIQKNYLVQDFQTDSRHVELAGSVHVQVGAASQDTVKETAWLQAQAAQTPHLPSAIVAFANLVHNDLPEILDAHRQHAHFRGIRQIIGRHPDEDTRTQTDDLISDKRFLDGLRLLEKSDVCFDLQMVPAQYARLADLLYAVPNLHVAICHFGSPWDRSTAGFAHWRNAMQRFSTLPNIYMKFSGFGMFKPDWNVDDIYPFVQEALFLFGPHRLMAGSNFPVDKLYGNYDRIWNALATLLPDANTYAHVTRKNAARFYRLAVS